MKKVAIIPGHGGFDSGAYNFNTKTRECDGNLSIALKLDYLLKYNGFQTVLSRITDVACGGAKISTQDVTNQINFANKSGADIAIAIHFNSSTNKTATGTEVLYTNYPTRDENEIRLAKLLLEELVNTTKLPNRGLKETPSGVGVIKKVKIPCVLSECAFVSNDKESIWCSDEQHNWQLAIAHAKAICRYYSITFKNPLLEVFLEMFKDVEKDRWSAKSIERLNKLGLIGGYPDGTFKPTKALTREEFAYVIDQLLKILGK